MDNDEFEELQPEQEKVAIYSKWAIIIISVLFSPFVGGLLLMLNLRRTGNKNAGYLVFFFGLAYTVIEKVIVANIIGLDITHFDPQKLAANPKFFYYSLALDILGAAILGEFFFKRYIKANSYLTRSPFPVLLIIIAVMFLLGFVMPRNLS